MSNSLSSGYYSDKASQAKDEHCWGLKVLFTHPIKTLSGKHFWKKHGSWPSVWHECKKCGKHIYTK